MPRPLSSVRPTEEGEIKKGKEEKGREEERRRGLKDETGGREATQSQSQQSEEGTNERFWWGTPAS